MYNEARFRWKTHASPSYDGGCLPETSGDPAMRRLLPALLVLFLASGAIFAGSWTQFRGPAGSGQPNAEKSLPAEIGPERNVLWKVPLAPGHSSPVVLGDRIYLTAVRDKKLFTLALDRGTGKTHLGEGSTVQGA